jgi:hypothetical protein
MALKLLLAFVLVDYTALCAYVLYEYGIGGMIAAATANPVTWAITVDLVISLSLVLTWMIRDARDRGVSVLPYALLTFALGSVGPLLYLLRRPGEAAVGSLAGPAVATRSIA